MRPVGLALVLAGSVLLLLGPFLPSAQYVSGDPPRVVGLQTYLGDAGGDSVVIITVAAGSMVLLLFRRFGAVRWSTSVGAVFVVAASLTEWTPRQFVSALVSRFEVNPSSMVRELGGGLSLFPAYGWAVMLLGAVALGTGAILPRGATGVGANSPDGQKTGQDHGYRGPRR